MNMAVPTPMTTGGPGGTTGGTVVNIFDHYWVVGGSSTQVYQSKSNTYVAVDNSDYVSWKDLRGGHATPIGSEVELADVLKSRGSPLPGWLWTASSFVQPTPTTYSKPQLCAYAADARYRRASGGLTISSINSVPFLTDPTSRNTVNSAWDYMNSMGGSQTINWKFSDGTFKVLTEAQVNTTQSTMSAFVQSCFTCESNTVDSINAGTITVIGQIDSAFNAIANVVP